MTHNENLLPEHPQEIIHYSQEVLRKPIFGRATYNPAHKNSLTHTVLCEHSPQIINYQPQMLLKEATSVKEDQAM